MKKIKKYIIIIILLFISFWAGVMFTSYNQKIDAIILKNGEGTTTVSISAFGQCWNYTTKSGALESIND